MKKILVTQRVENITEYFERRDSIDQRWTEFLLSIDLLPIFASNNQTHVEWILKNEMIDGVILTGGENLLKYRGSSPERDSIERYILEWTIHTNKPILGVCRGMQVIQDYFDVPLELVKNHVGVRHKVIVKKGLNLTKFIEEYKDVNSFHNFGSTLSNYPLEILASSNDGVVMAIEHNDKNIYGIMWHPEREKPFKSEDKKLFRRLFS